MSDIRERISKLLEMADSGTENERKVAMVKAQELLLKYHIEMADVLGCRKEDVVEIQCSSAVNLYIAWEQKLHYIIANNFRCEPLIVSVKYKKGKVKAAIFCGTRTDAETARSIMEYAVATGRRGADHFIAEFRKQTKMSCRGIGTDYLDGFVEGISEGFHDQLVENNKYALVAIVPEEVKEHCKSYEESQFIAPTLAEAAGYAAVNRFGFEDGYDASKYKPGAKGLETEFAE